MNAQTVAAISPTEEYFDLGDFTRAITTTSQDAQIWFDRGLTWAYSFNHEEAAFCFNQVIAHDPECAMGYWGVAFASGPNYNKEWQAFDPLDLKVSLATCHTMALKAGELADGASPVEKALIDAIQQRFPAAEIPDGDFGPSMKAYAERMRTVYLDFGAEDLDITTLAADALMNMAPWQLYEPRTGRPNLDTPVLEVKEILELGMKQPGADHHPGVLHMFIHLMEMSNTPEAAIKASNKLRHLVPEAGHMLHMPSHIDILIGEYGKAVEANARASVANNKYFAKQRPGHRVFYNIYRFHDYHTLIYAAMMSGQSTEALQATESYASVRIHVLIRFGMWEELKRLSFPKDKALYCVLTATTYYGKAIAWAATQGLEEAEKEARLFHEATARVPETRFEFPNKVTDILQVAAAMLDGELQYRRGNYHEAFESLRLAIKRDDGLIYSEPWAWMLPARHPYGALLLEQGRVEEAAEVYAQDLGLEEGQDSAHQHPNNIWGLHGVDQRLDQLKRDAVDLLIGESRN
ncbi:hypothetical protein FSARC_6695 [Fusarium sarcochroum]|uniref:TPR domain protein n=1 Tax=Fusarium sarcochroum TaxID=1208366 RepID=A0A8H4TX23_9HYPO|nr:hypothetical protein FSARC_6695 [Fusarium sarcochroum]